MGQQWVHLLWEAEEVGEGSVHEEEVNVPNSAQMCRANATN
jgi:hypothetical protein